MTEFRCKPTDYEKLPWVAGCQECAHLHSDPEPGLFFWLQAVAYHFRDDHQVTLVSA